MKLPAIQFYPADWRKDPGVQSLDFEARGVWFEILCLMHESDRRGVLLLNGLAMPDEALARLLGVESILLKQILTKIETYGVASRENGTGALVCRRMVRDEELRQIRAECGKKGGNPALLKQIPTTCDNQNTTTRLKQIPTPSSSSSISSTNTDKTTARAVAKSDAQASPTAKPQLSDDEWLKSLESDAAWQGIPVRIEYGKCRAWCEVNRKQLSRRRFVNWLNRAERPLNAAPAKSGVPAPRGKIEGHQW